MRFGTAGQKLMAQRLAWRCLNVGFGAAFAILVLLGIFFAATGDEARLFFALFAVLAMAAVVLSAAGCALLARSKGQSPLYGGLGLVLAVGAYYLVGGPSTLLALGLAVLVAPAVIMALPDRWAEELERQAPPRLGPEAGNPPR